MFMATSVYMTFVRVNHPERFTRDPGGAEPVREAAVDAVDARLGILNEELTGAPWFMRRSSNRRLP